MMQDMEFKVKHKVEELMSKIDPSDHMHEAGYTVNGRYTDKERYSTFYSPQHWTHSFYLGMVAHLYSVYREPKYLNYLYKAKEVYWNYLNDTEHMVSHDTGFLYSLYAVAIYKLTGDTEMRKMALRAADEIGKRYQFHPKIIDAFGDVHEENHENSVILMIVDDMMNMCLLMWAYGETRHSFYKQVFINHIETAIKYLIRDDYSVRHAYHFDNRTGNPLCEMNYCGYSIGSHWARGTAWMIFGLTKALEYTGDENRYLPPLIGVAEKYLSGLSDSNVPVWDFRAVKEGYINKDTSAAAIIGCAFSYIKKMNPTNVFLKKYGGMANYIYEELKNYVADDNSENILEKTQCGELETGSLWGDYFFTELMLHCENQCVDFWV